MTADSETRVLEPAPDGQLQPQPAPRRHLHRQRSAPLLGQARGLRYLVPARELLLRRCFRAVHRSPHRGAGAPGPGCHLHPGGRRLRLFGHHRGARPERGPRGGDRGQSGHAPGGARILVAPCGLEALPHRAGAPALLRGPWTLARGRAPPGGGHREPRRRALLGSGAGHPHGRPRGRGPRRGCHARGLRAGAPHRVSAVVLLRAGAALLRARQPVRGFQLLPVQSLSRVA